MSQYFTGNKKELKEKAKSLKERIAQLKEEFSGLVSFAIRTGDNSPIALFRGREDEFRQNVRNCEAELTLIKSELAYRDSSDFIPALDVIEMSDKKLKKAIKSKKSEIRDLGFELEELDWEVEEFDRDDPINDEGDLKELKKERKRKKSKLKKAQTRLKELKYERNARKEDEGGDSTKWFDDIIAKAEKAINDQLKTQPQQTQDRQPEAPEPLKAAFHAFNIIKDMKGAVRDEFLRAAAGGNESLTHGSESHSPCKSFILHIPSSETIASLRKLKENRDNQSVLDKVRQNAEEARKEFFRINARVPLKSASETIKEAPDATIADLVRDILYKGENNGVEFGYKQTSSSEPDQRRATLSEGQRNVLSKLNEILKERSQQKPSSETASTFTNNEDFAKQEQRAQEKFDALRKRGLIDEYASTHIVRKSRSEIIAIINQQLPVMPNFDDTYLTGEAIAFVTDDGKSLISSPYIVRYDIFDEDGNSFVGLEKVTQTL